jgi:hypothetical protein
MTSDRTVVARPAGRAAVRGQHRGRLRGRPHQLRRKPPLPRLHGWELSWYSAQPSLAALLGEREIGLFHLVSYLRHDDRVYEIYWTKRRGVEALDNSYALMNLSVNGRQEAWADSPPGWPPVDEWPGGRPMGQCPRLDRPPSCHPG